MTSQSRDSFGDIERWRTRLTEHMRDTFKDQDFITLTSVWERGGTLVNVGRFSVASAGSVQSDKMVQVDMEDINIE